MPVDIVLTNEIRVRRKGEWLCRGLPFPQGTLTDIGGLRLQDEAGGEVPLSSEILARWLDGSVKWALLTDGPQTAHYDVEIAADVYDGDEAIGQSHGWVAAGGGNRGWPLIALCSVYRATGEERYAEAAKVIVASFAEGPDPLAARAPVGVKHGYQAVVSTGNSISILWRDNLRFFWYADKAGLLRDF